jgi:hypothetical protein
MTKTRVSTRRAVAAAGPSQDPQGDDESLSDESLNDEDVTQGQQPYPQAPDGGDDDDGDDDKESGESEDEDNTLQGDAPFTMTPYGQVLQLRTSADDRKRYFSGMKPFTETYDGKPSNMPSFLDSIRRRATLLNCNEIFEVTKGNRQLSLSSKTTHKSTSKGSKKQRKAVLEKSRGQRKLQI